MKKISPNKLVYIDPIHGLHYHMKECWMAGPMAIKFKDAIVRQGTLGLPYIFCESCVLAYLDGKQIPKLPIFKR